MLLLCIIQDEWEADKAERVRKLEEQHMRSLRHVGDAHLRASQQVCLAALWIPALWFSLFYLTNYYN